MAPYTPRPVVEVAFGYAPFDASPVWTDISSFVRSVRTNRGRTSEFDQFPAGTCSVALVDPDRTFDPTNTAGPYYGQLLPNVPIRVVAPLGGTDYPVFYGFVDGWEQGYVDANNHVVVTVTATDGTKILGQKPLPQSVYETAVLDSSPAVYWKLDEPTGTVVVDSSGNRLDGAYVGDVERGVASRVGGQGVSFPGGVGTLVRAGTAAHTTGAFECWLRVTETPSTEMLLYRTATSVFSVEAVTLSTSGGVALKGGGVGRIASAVDGFGRPSTVALLDGGWHHLVVDITNLAFYLDGVQVATQGLLTTDPGPPYAVIVGGSTQASYGPVEMSDVALYDTPPSAAEIAAHYEAGVRPWDGDTTGTRIGRILDLIGWPAGMRSVDSGEVLVGPAALDQRTAWDLLQQLAATEQGRLFFGPDGKLVFHQADHDLTASEGTTSQFTFSDDGDDLGVLVGSLKFALDDRFIYNEAQVSRVGGSTVTVRDDASIGTRTWTLSGLFRDDRQARHVAERKVALYAEPRSRADAWRVNPEKDPSTWGDILSLDIGHRVTLELTPARTGTQTVADMYVESVEHEITPSTWVVGFRGAPVDPYVDAYFTWGGDDATQGWGVGVWR